MHHNATQPTTPANYPTPEKNAGGAKLGPSTERLLQLIDSTKEAFWQLGYSKAPVELGAAKLRLFHSTYIDYVEDCPIKSRVPAREWALMNRLPTLLLLIARNEPEDWLAIEWAYVHRDWNDRELDAIHNALEASVHAEAYYRDYC